MAATILFTGPVPPAGQLYCTVCAAEWKQVAMAALKTVIEQAQRRKGSFTTTLDLSAAMKNEPALAVAHGIFLPLAQPPNGNGLMPLPVPLCWSHMLALTLHESAVMPASAGMMPQNPGGAVLLDRR